MYYSTKWIFPIRNFTAFSDFFSFFVSNVFLFSRRKSNSIQLLGTFHCSCAKIIIQKKKKTMKKNVRILCRFRGMLVRSQLLSVMNWNELTQTSPTEYTTLEVRQACGNFPFIRISNSTKNLKLVSLFCRCVVGAVAFSTYGCQQCRIRTLTHEMGLCVHWTLFSHNVRIEKTKRIRVKCTYHDHVRNIFIVNLLMALCAYDVHMHVAYIKWNRKCV